MRLFKLLGQWLDFRAKLAILRFKFLYRVFVLCIEQHYLRFVLFFLSRVARATNGATGQRRGEKQPFWRIDPNYAGWWRGSSSGAVGFIDWLDGSFGTH